jgi:hypothetical protein
MKPIGKFQYANIYLIHLPIHNGVQQGEVLLPFLFNFTFNHTIWEVQANQKGFNGTYQLLVCADYVNLMRENQWQLIQKGCRAAALPEIFRKITPNIRIKVFFKRM